MRYDPGEKLVNRWGFWVENWWKLKIRRKKGLVVISRRRGLGSKNPKRVLIMFFNGFCQRYLLTRDFPRRESRKMVVISTLKKEGKKNDHPLISDIERLGLLEGQLG